METTNVSGTAQAGLIAPVTLLIALGILTWATVFAGGIDDTPPALAAHAEDQIDGVEAAQAAVRLALEVVEGEHGLLDGPPERVYVRHDGLRSASYWTVLIEGPVRHRPNTVEEFTIQGGQVVIEVSAFTGELSGNFSAGVGVLRDLGISGDGFAPVPLQLVWPPGIP